MIQMVIGCRWALISAGTTLLFSDGLILSACEERYLGEITHTKMELKHDETRATKWCNEQSSALHGYMHSTIESEIKDSASAHE